MFPQLGHRFDLNRTGELATFVLFGNSLSEWIRSIPIGELKGLAEIFCYVGVGLYWVVRAYKRAKSSDKSESA